MTDRKILTLAFLAGVLVTGLASWYAKTEINDAHDLKVEVLESKIGVLEDKLGWARNEASLTEGMLLAVIQGSEVYTPLVAIHMLLHHEHIVIEAGWKAAEGLIKKGVNPWMVFLEGYEFPIGIEKEYVQRFRLCDVPLPQENSHTKRVKEQICGKSEG